MKKVTMILLYFFCLLFSYCWHLCPSFPIISSYTHINPFTFSKSWEDIVPKHLEWLLVVFNTVGLRVIILFFQFFWVTQVFLTVSVLTT